MPTPAGLFDDLLIAWLLLAVATFVALFFVTAPYGRHSRAGWGPALTARVGWILMEAPGVLLLAAGFALGRRTSSPTSVIFLVLWEAHYVYRAFIYPLGLRSGARMPLAVAGMGFGFNLVNGYFNARYLFVLAAPYPDRWLLDPRFLAGLALFVAGFALHAWSDHILRDLRAPGESGYRIPRAGFFRWVSSPNYLGEIMEWTGWALLTWSLAGAAFAAWTIANLAPRARAHHRWYRERFADYPTERRALIPWPGRRSPGA